MTKIMVLGGAGFIGSHVVDLLHIPKQNTVCIFDNLSTGKWDNIKHLFPTEHNTRMRFVDMDVSNPVHVEQAFCEFTPEVVILLAAQAAISKSLEDPSHDMDINIGGMLNVISSAKKFNARRIVFSSTSAVYKEKPWGKLREKDICEPQSPYGISKLAAENYLRTLFPESVILRFGNVFGPRQVPIGENQVIPRAIRHFRFGDDFQVFGNGRQTRDYVYVEDVAEAIEAAMTGAPGTYNIGTGKRRTVNEVVETLAELYEVPNYPWEHRAEGDLRKDICLDFSNAEKGLGWWPRVSFREGLKRTMEWWEQEEKPIPVKIPVCEAVR